MYIPYILKSSIENQIKIKQSQINILKEMLDESKKYGTIMNVFKSPQEIEDQTERNKEKLKHFQKELWYLEFNQKFCFFG